MRGRVGLGLAAAALVALAAGANAETAREGMVLAAVAADAWADDARLVWVENDTPVDAQGQAPSWGYLYYSPEKHAMRSWSVSANGIDKAMDHTVVAAAPAVDTNWKDSAEIATVAEKAVADELAGGGQLETLLLVRGVFAADTAWVAVFATGPGPRLFVLFDAKSGDLVRRWRG